MSKKRKCRILPLRIAVGSQVGLSHKGCPIHPPFRRGDRFPYLNIHARGKAAHIEASRSASQSRNWN
jgi:hypothetical protein